MTREELLLELRDIGAPAEPAWWLLAPGYLLLIILASVGVGLLLYWLRRRRKRQLLILAKSELHGFSSGFVESGDAQLLLQQLSRWLKQVAILAYPERRPQALSGIEWLVFLDEVLGDKRFSAGHGRVFGDAVYRQRAEFDATRVLDLCEIWLQAVKPRLLQRGSD